VGPWGDERSAVAVIALRGDPSKCRNPLSQRLHLYTISNSPDANSPDKKELCSSTGTDVVSGAGASKTM